jgi:hypothetical protein
MAGNLEPVDQLIRTFRTITTIINVLQNSNLPKTLKQHTSDNNIASRNDRKVLKLLSALAKLFVRNHEVTATASKLQVQADGLNIKIIAVVATANPDRETEERSDALGFRGDVPTVLEPLKENGVVDLEDPVTYVLRTW